MPLTPAQDKLRTGKWHLDNDYCSKENESRRLKRLKVRQQPQGVYDYRSSLLCSYYIGNEHRKEDVCENETAIADTCSEGPKCQPLMWWQIFAKKMAQSQWPVPTWYRTCPLCASQLLQGESSSFCCNKGKNIVSRLPELSARISLLTYDLPIAGKLS